MTETNVYVGAKLPETQSVGGFRAVPRNTVQTGQLYWDVYFGDRSVGQLDGITARQVTQVMRAMCKVQDLAAGDTRSEIRKALGIFPGAR